MRSVRETNPSKWNNLEFCQLKLNHSAPATSLPPPNTPVKCRAAISSSKTTEQQQQQHLSNTIPVYIYIYKSFMPIDFQFAYKMQTLKSMLRFFFCAAMLQWNLNQKETERRKERERERGSHLLIPKFKWINFNTASKDTVKCRPDNSLNTHFHFWPSLSQWPMWLGSFMWLVWQASLTWPGLVWYVLLCSAMV